MQTSLGKLPYPRIIYGSFPKPCPSQLRKKREKERKNINERKNLTVRLEAPDGLDFHLDVILPLERQHLEVLRAHRRTELVLHY